MVSKEHIDRISSYLQGLEHFLLQQNLKKEAEKVNGFNSRIKSGDVTHDYSLGIFFYRVCEIINSMGGNIKDLTKKILPDYFAFMTSKYELENGMNVPKTTYINSKVELEDILKSECCWILDNHRPSISCDFDDTFINFKSPLGMYLESGLYYIYRGRIDQIVCRTKNLVMNRISQLKEKEDDLQFISAMVKETRDLPVYLMERTVADVDINPTMTKLMMYIRERLDFRNDDMLYIQIVTRSDPYTVYVFLSCDKVKRELEQLNVVVSQIIGNKWEKKIVEPRRFLWQKRNLPDRILVYTGEAKMVVPSKKKCLLSLNGKPTPYAIFIPETQVYLPNTEVLVCDAEDYRNNRNDLPTVRIDKGYNQPGSKVWEKDVDALINNGKLNYKELTYSLSRN